MREPSGPGSPPSKLSENLNQHLEMYALAAAAAGVSLLALTRPAEAKIVYTKTHRVIGYNGVYELDLNHDGVVDFLIQQYGTSSSNRLLAKEALGNALAGNVKSNTQFRSVRHYASALKLGEWIGRRQHFISGGRNGETMVWFWEDPDIGQPHTYGKWINVDRRYLGLKFVIKGKTHYGWARLNVNHVLGDIAATLTEYAYQTTPNRSLRAGQTTEERQASIPNQNPDTGLPQATLGA